MSQPREHKRADDLVEELAAEAAHGYDLSKGRPVDRRSLGATLAPREGQRALIAPDQPGEASAAGDGLEPPPAADAPTG
jgi:hypothetical protein